MAAPKGLFHKPRALTEQETQTSFDNWLEGMTFQISLSDKSTRFLSSGDLSTWTTATDKGFTDDGDVGDGITVENKMNKAAKASLLNIVLGSIAGYAPVISARFIKKQTTSLESIWSRLRSHYGFRRTGARMLDLMDIKLEMNESRESLWERMYSFLEDQMLTKDGSVLHNDVKLEHDEEITPTLVNLLVTLWLFTINPVLPTLVKQRFATQLRSCTIYTLRDEISDAIPSIITDLEEKEASVNRLFGASQKFKGGYNTGAKNWSGNNSGARQWNNTGNKRNCCLCEALNKPSTNHFLSTCPYLPANDKKFLSRAREISVPDDDEGDEDFSHFQSANSRVTHEQSSKKNSHKMQFSVRKVDVDASPVLAVTVNGMTSYWTLDSGAEASVMEEAECIRLGLECKPTNHRATQGDGKTPLETIGEVHFLATRGHHTLAFSGLVVRCADSPVLAGAAFHRINHLTIDYGRHYITIDNCCEIRYDPTKKKTRSSRHRALRVNKQTCVLPGEYVSFQLPDELCTADAVAIEPRTTVSPDMPDWIQCQILQPEADGSILVRNTSSSPVLLSKHDQPCQVRPTVVVDLQQEAAGPPNCDSTVRSLLSDTPKVNLTVDTSSPEVNKKQKARLDSIHKDHSAVFSSGIGAYNDGTGKIGGVLNMNENLPPQRKGRVPDYSKGDKDILQEKIDYLHSEGVLSRAEDANQPVEYVHPTFLVKKSSGGHRLVTSFGEMAEYVKPQPTINTNVEHAIHQIGQYNVLIITDLKEGYFQITIPEESSKYLGVVSPYKGTYVYRRAVMGLPGSEALLEELLSRIFGDLIQEGKMTKVSDDMFIGSYDVNSLTDIWEEVLIRLEKNGLKLSPNKTKICPTSATILGWEWSKGSIKPGKHRINALITCEPPQSVKSLRSYIGCFKFISRVLPHYAEFMQPLEEMCAGKQSAEKLVWTDELLAVFNKSKDHLNKAQPVVLPKRDEQLHIVTDACATGIAATMYVIRNDKLQLAGYFSAALRKNQSKLLPCESEALAISVGLKHFSYYIVQSTAKTRVLTDSRPCVLAYKKLQRGEFSSSPKVTTFLSTASRYAVEILHIPGSSNLFSDFASRNPVPCDTSTCDICSFINETSSSAVGEISVSDVISGREKVPFATMGSWLKVQQACPNLTRVHTYLSTGATVPKRKKNLTDVKRYLSCGVTKLSGQHEGLLVVKVSTPFKPVSVRVVIPREVSAGLLTAIHLSLNHPSLHQLKLIFGREFFCLDMDAVARKVTEQCHTCAALKTLPSTYHQQTTSIPADVVGVKFSADVVKRFSQCILLIREDITSYTVGTIIADEKAVTLREGILLLMSQVRSQLGPHTQIRTDPATSLRALVKDGMLEKHNLHIELGDEKNVNKNPIAEATIRELHLELKKLQPLGGRITGTTLARAISNMNSLIRHHQLSASEMWTKRSMSTGKPITLDDADLIQKKYTQRCNNHDASAKSKSGGKSPVVFPPVNVGQLVYLYSDGSKLKTRDRYLVTAVEEAYVWVQKFTTTQFRKREYRVKRSDLILIPEEINQQIKPTMKIPHEYNHPVSTPLAGKSDYRLSLNLQLRPGYNVPTEDSDDSSEESEDEVCCDDVMRFFLPNPVVTDQLEVQSSTDGSISTESDAQQSGTTISDGAVSDPEPNGSSDHSVATDAAEVLVVLKDTNARPVRKKRRPVRLRDYVTQLHSDDGEEQN